VFPLFLVMLLAMIDFGYGVFQDSQATAAARDGARIAIFDPTDVASIEAEARARATGQQVDVAVTCWRGPQGTASVACGSAVPGRDLVRVVASWDYASATGVGRAFGADRRIVGSSTMEIIGRAVTVTEPPPGPPPPGGGGGGGGGGPAPPGGCAVESIAPTNVGFRANDRAYPHSQGVTFEVTTNGAATCTALRLSLPHTAGTQSVALVPVNAPQSWRLDVARRAYNLPPGQQTIRVTDSAGTPLPGPTITIG
jgi:hypothetical protein